MYAGTHAHFYSCHVFYDLPILLARRRVWDHLNVSFAALRTQQVNMHRQALRGRFSTPVYDKMPKKGKKKKKKEQKEQKNQKGKKINKINKEERDGVFAMHLSGRIMPSLIEN